eukprot:gb/GECG01001091.1/.p1 GENE.gb/GECG01001091.1/~~gb/GECG01001091.1/.p1  ORF type:complete len:870 (+),score=141.19 gb/GECG01001091.1/:1-2610(+)
MAREALRSRNWPETHHQLYDTKQSSEAHTMTANDVKLRGSTRAVEGNGCRVAQMSRCKAGASWNSTLLVATMTLLTLMASVSEAMVLGIDMGSAFMKVALVKPGSPFQIVTNPQSKRTTPTMVAFTEGQRLYGVDADSLSRRRPAFAFHNPLMFLGRTFQHPSVQHYLNTSYLPYDLKEVEDTHGIGYILEASEETFETNRTFRAEEVAAMLLSYARRFSSTLADRSLSDAVITVPSYFTQAERHAMLHAAKLADLNVLAMVDNPVAASVQYGIDKVYANETHRILIFDMGAESTEAAVAEYTAYTPRKNARPIGQAQILSKAWSEGAGGNEIDRRVAEALAKVFNDKHGPGTKDNEADIRTQSKGYSKLLSSSKKLKEILSANDAFPVMIESITPEIDFRSNMNRSFLEEIISDVIDRSVGAGMEALERSGLRVDQIDEIELVGGSVRIPLLQQRLKERLGIDRLSVHLNGDEAMALGAAFVAANRSKAFRVRNVGIIDTNEFPVEVRLQDLNPKVGSEPWIKQSTLVEKRLVIPTSRKVAFKHDQDLFVSLDYVDEVPQRTGSNQHVLAYEITGIEKAANSDEAKRTDKTPKVSISFEVNQHGLLRIKHAEATIDEVIVVPLNVSSSTNATKSNDTTTAEASGSPEAEATEKAETEKSEESAQAEGKQSETEEKSEEEVKTTNYTEVHRFPLDAKPVPSREGFTPLGEESLGESKEVMDELQSMDDAQAARAQAKNEYEAYIYSQREKMMMSRAEEAEQVATEDVRQSLSQELENAEDWLYDEGENASPEEYRKKQDSLKKQFDPVWFRADELTERPAAIKRARKLVANITADVQDWNDTKPHVSTLRSECIRASRQCRRWEWGEES